MKTIQEIDKDIQSYLKKMAAEMDASYIEYSDDTVILTLPITQGRFQSVKGFIIHKNDHIFLTFTSTICRLNEFPNVDYKKMLELNFDLCFSKITLEDNLLEVAASTIYEICTPEQVKAMLTEVAHTADSLEMELTGADSH